MHGRARSAQVYFNSVAAALARGWQNGIVVCFGAGNSLRYLKTGWYAWPGSHTDVIAVGGVQVNYDPSSPTLDLEASNYASSFNSTFYSGRHVPDLLRPRRPPDNATGAGLVNLPLHGGTFTSFI
jgi:serine protease AprX